MHIARKPLPSLYHRRTLYTSNRLFWGTEYDPDDGLSYEIIGPHCVTALVQYIDGFWINRIPIRFNHWYVTLLPYSAMYSTWTVLQGIVFDIDNPDTSDEEDDTVDKVKKAQFFAEDSVIDFAGFLPLSSTDVSLSTIEAAQLRRFENPTDLDPGNFPFSINVERNGITSRLEG